MLTFPNETAGRAASGDNVLFHSFSESSPSLLTVAHRARDLFTAFSQAIPYLELRIGIFESVLYVEHCANHFILHHVI